MNFIRAKNETTKYLFSVGGLDSNWLPMLCVLTFVAAYSVGLNPISWLLVGEIFPLEFRETGTSLATGFSYVCAFVGVKTFVDLREAVGLHGTFWTYAVISFLGLLFRYVIHRTPHILSCLSSYPYQNLIAMLSRILFF